MRLLRVFCRSFELPITIARPFNTYGPRQSARAVIPTVISQVCSGAKKIKVGALTPTRDFNYVADTVSGFLAIAESDQTNGKVINIGSGQEISIANLIQLIFKVTGREADIECEEKRLRPAKSEVNRLLCDATQLKDLTGWQPQHSLEEGICQTTEWIKEHPEHFKPQEFSI